MSLKAKGGITKGKSHAEGGMPMVVKSTGQKVELEGGEGVINKKNMADTQKHEFEGKMLTKCEIASEINSDGGNGVEIDCDGIVGKKYKHQDGGRLAEGGDVKEKYEVYIDFMNRDKNFATDRKYFKTYEDAERWAKKEFDSFNPDMISYTYAKGGEVTFTDTNTYSKRRGFDGGGVKIWESYKNIHDNKSVGAFSHKRNNKYVGDYYLFLLDDYDRNFYAHLPLKPNEMIFRTETERGRISKSLPLVKINIMNGRVYFLSDDNDFNSDEDDKNPKFNKASADVNYLSLDDRIRKYNQGFITYNELLKKVDETYAEGGVVKPNIAYIDAIGSFGTNDDSWELVTNILKKHNIEVDNSKDWHTKGYAEELYEERGGTPIFTIKLNMNDAPSPRKLKKEISNLPSRINYEFTYDYAKGGRLGDIKFDVEEVARQFDAIDSDGTKYEGEVINPLSKSEKNQIIKAIKNIVEKVDGRFIDIVVDDFTNEEIYINLIFDNDVYDNSPQDIILYRKTFELNNSDEPYIDHRYLYESGYKYANGGNLDGFDETWNRFKENTREAFGQPRNNNVVRLQSDFGFKKIELPQLRTKDKPMFVKSLISKYGANVVSEGFKVKASQLKPIQNEINLEQVEVISNVSKGKMNPNKPITISQDGYVIDGHHRWYYAKENDLKLSVLQINLNAMQVIDEIWQSGLAKKEDISSVRMKQGGKI